MIGISKTDLKIVVRSVSHKFNSTKKGQLSANKRTPVNTAPSAPQQELTDLTDTQAKNAHPGEGCEPPCLADTSYTMDL